MNTKEQLYTQHASTPQQIALAISALHYHNHQLTYSQQIEDTMSVLSWNMWNFIKLPHLESFAVFEQVSDFYGNVHVVEN